MFPRINSTLSAYLKNSRYRTGASVALAIAAAAGVGTASATAGAGPWASSLNSLAIPGHGTSHAPAGQAGTNTFHAVVAPAPGSQALGKHPAAPRSGQQPPRAGQPRGANIQLAAQQKPAAPPPHAQPPHQVPSGILAALPPLPAHHAAPARQPGPAKAPAVKAPAVKAPAPVHFAAPARPAAPAQPYTIYDAVRPDAIPSGQQQVAVYGNGNYQASWSAVHGRSRVLWIDTNGSNPGCDVLDVEPGDATPSGAAVWVRQRLTRWPNHLAVVYTMRSEWNQVKAAIASLPGPMQSRVRYWIADPTGVPHIVPGSNATQWYWGSNFDKTMALPGFDG